MYNEWKQNKKAEGVKTAAAERKEKPASEEDQTFELCFLLKYLY